CSRVCNLDAPSIFSSLSLHDALPIFRYAQKGFLGLQRPLCGLALRGRCPLARFACLPHVRHVAGVRGIRPSASFPAPMPERWGRCVASRVRLRPASSPVRCSPRWGCAPRAASGAALDPTPLGCRSWPPVLLERNQGQDLMGGTRPKGGGATVHS